MCFPAVCAQQKEHDEGPLNVSEISHFIVLYNRSEPAKVVELISSIPPDSYHLFSEDILDKASYSSALLARVDLTVALTDVLLGKAIRASNNYLKGLAYFNRGFVFAQTGRYDLAIDSLLMSLANVETSASRHLLARVKGGLALMYVEISEYELARPYFNEALLSHESENDKLNIAIILMNRSFMKIHLREFNSARVDLTRALLLAKEVQFNPALPLIYSNLAVIAGTQGGGEIAFKYFHQALEVASKYQLEFEGGEILKQKANVEFKLGRIANARNSLDRSIELARKYKLLQKERNSLFLLAQIEASQNNYRKAYQLKEEASRLSQQMGESRIATNLSRLERYTASLKEQNKRLTLEQEKKIANLAAEREYLLRNFFIAVSGIAILLAVYFIRQFIYTREKARLFEKQSKIDSLTGVWNRRAGESQLTRLCARELESLKVFSIAMLDIDHFKRVNDAYGHDIGDKVIIAVATIIQDSLRPADMLCRWGGEEFIIILDNFNADKAFDVCERIRQKIENTVIEPIGKVTVSIGVSMFEDDGIYELIKRGDQALYRAKDDGRNRVLIRKKINGIV